MTGPQNTTPLSVHMSLVCKGEGGGLSISLCVLGAGLLSVCVLSLCVCPSVLVPLVRAHRLCSL